MSNKYSKSVNNKFNNLNSLISADYSLNLSDTIGKRPVVSARHHESEIPAIFSGQSKVLRTDAGCNGPTWNKNCI